MKIDLHVHSAASPDGRSSLSALAAAAARRGLDAIVITDHDRFTLTEPQQLHGVWLLPGIECSTDAGHILGLLPDRIPTLPPGDPLPDAAAVTDALRCCGAVTVLAHPFARPVKAVVTCTDAIETANARAYVRNYAANQQAAALALQHTLPQTGGSDAHSAREVGNAYTELDAPDIALEQLRAALLSGNATPVLRRNTPRRYKGRSQLCKARRFGNLRRRLRALAYLAYCILQDLTKGVPS